MDFSVNLTLLIQLCLGIRAEAGSMIYMTDGVRMVTSTGGGWTQGLQRSLTGGSFFVVDFVNKPPEEEETKPEPNTNGKMDELL